MLLALPNRDWPGFHPSPESRRYYSPVELAALGARHGFQVRLFGVFPQDRLSIAQRVLWAARRVSTALGLVPKDWQRTERIRSLLKRLLYGKLEPLPAEVALDAGVGCGVTPLPTDRADAEHRVFYVEATVA